MAGQSNEEASPLLHLGALPPSPRNFPPYRQNGWLGAATRLLPPHAIPATESALGVRSRSALSSAQVLPEWTTATSPCDDFSGNGDYPLNFLSHLRGSVQVDTEAQNADLAFEVRNFLT